MDPLYAQLTAAQREPDNSVASDGACERFTRNLTRVNPPLSVAVLGDTFVYDGMKAYFVDYLRALQHHNVTATWVDTMCVMDDSDTPPYANTTGESVAAAAVVAAGIRLVRICTRMAFAEDAAEFLAFAALGGPLYQTRSWSNVPLAGRQATDTVTALLARHDVLVSTWQDDGERPLHSHFLNQLVYLRRPAVSRVLDLGTLNGGRGELHRAHV